MDQIYHFTSDDVNKKDVDVMDIESLMGSLKNYFMTKHLGLHQSSCSSAVAVVVVACRHE